MKSDLGQYYPKIYENVLETDELVKTENKLFDDLNLELIKAINNQFAHTADENGIKAYENILNIVADPATEDLTFRRQRVINRLSMRAPYTMAFLKHRLDEIIGMGKWDAYADYDNQTLYIESTASNQQWFEEILIMINTIKPANMVFINIPSVEKEILVSEEIKQNACIYNYKLGTTWLLGYAPFGTTEDRGVIKLPTVQSIQDNFLFKIADFTANEIKKVLINDVFEISEFELKENDENVAEIQYIVDKEESGLSEIINIKLMDGNGEILTNSVVYVPIIEDVLIKHDIKIKEGA